MTDVVMKNWDPQKVIDAVADQLIANADDVGSFTVAQARRNLLRINQPHWGRRYRAALAFKRLKYVVERKPREVTISVGIETSPDSRHHGFYIEMGSVNYAAQPWLRPAVFENGSAIVGLIAK